MLTEVIWWSGILLEAVIAVRGLRGKLFSHYPAFYLYLVSVVFVEIARFYTYHWMLGIYPHVYWNTQFVSLVIGCAVISEIYRVGLKGFPGTARMARNLLWFVFALVFAKAIATSADGVSWWKALTAMKLERDLRIVQAGSLIALVAVFLAYAIPLSRNLKGIIAGYGIFLGTSVFQLTVMVHLGAAFRGAWDYLRSAMYLFVLILWVASLWNYQEAPRPAHTITLDEDYKMLVAGTRKQFQKTRLALGKAVRP